MTKTDGHSGSCKHCRNETLLTRRGALQFLFSQLLGGYEVFKASQQRIGLESSRLIAKNLTTNIEWRSPIAQISIALIQSLKLDSFHLCNATMAAKTTRRKLVAKGLEQALVSLDKDWSQGHVDLHPALSTINGSLNLEDPSPKLVPIVRSPLIGGSHASSTWLYVAVLQCSDL